MNRRFILPAALALTAHALLFLGSGKPPPPSPNNQDSAKPEEEKKKDDDQKRLVLLTPDDFAAAAKSETPGGGMPDEGPPGPPDTPPIERPNDRERITQDYIPIHPGTGTNIFVERLPEFGPGNGKGPGSLIFRPDELDDAPHTRFQKEPVYPFAMKASGMTGTVWVEFIVDERGRVHDVRVVKSTNTGFNESTIAAVSEWRFEPGKHRNLPVRFHMSIPIVFNLND